MVGARRLGDDVRPCHSDVVERAHPVVDVLVKSPETVSTVGDSRILYGLGRGSSSILSWLEPRGEQSSDRPAAYDRQEPHPISLLH